jgi:ATP-dependent DNA ligase
VEFVGGVSAQVLAVREDDTWRYIGHVGTGLSHQTLEKLHGKLVKLKVTKSPFPGKVKGRTRDDLGQAVAGSRG